MNITSFLEHHGIVRNPFAEEDAATDQVFKEFCIANAYHPIWDKVYGDPNDPSTSIVFGPKGSGKTAMRLQVDRHLQTFNAENPGRGIYVIRYDDFNPFLDHFASRMNARTQRQPEKVLERWKLWDHMDSILCLGVTDLVDRILKPDHPSAIADATIEKLDHTAARDLLLLAAAYDQSTDDSFAGRWGALRRRLRYGNWFNRWPLILAMLSFIASLALVGYLFARDRGDAADPVSPHVLWIIPAVTIAGSLPFLARLIKWHIAAGGMRRHMRVGKREVGPLRRTLMQFPPAELVSQPLPRHARTDDRYELLHKFQAILKRVGFGGGIVVLMDRVDEPHMTGGQVPLMKRFVWPILDNKLLKHPGTGFKLFLPKELYAEVEREDAAFSERARMDKQNVIPAFGWTGEALYDLVRARMMACAAADQTPDPRELFDGVSYERLLTAFQSLRVPRHLFRFLYRVLVEHCGRHTDADPVFKIDEKTFESMLAVYDREVQSI